MKENRVLEISFCYFSRLQIVKYSKFFCSITSQQKKEISRSFENLIFFFLILKCSYKNAMKNLGLAQREVLAKIFELCIEIILADCGKVKT